MLFRSTNCIHSYLFIYLVAFLVLKQQMILKLFLFVSQAAVPFWPERDSKKLRVKVDGCQTSAQAINFHQPENCLLLRLDNAVSSLNDACALKLTRAVTVDDICNQVLIGTITKQTELEIFV